MHLQLAPVRLDKPTEPLDVPGPCHRDQLCSHRPPRSDDPCALALAPPPADTGSQQKWAVRKRPLPSAPGSVSVTGGTGASDSERTPTIATAGHPTQWTSLPDEGRGERRSAREHAARRPTQTERSQPPGAGITQP